MKVAILESLGSAVESFATVVALAAAGWWTFLLFIQKREKYPRARTTHSIVLLGELDGYKLLRVSVKVENLGSVLVDLCRGKAIVQAVRPLPEAWKAAILSGEDLPRVDDCEFSWPPLKEFTLEWGGNGYRIEPLESEEFHFDVALESRIEAIQVYSYFQNVIERSREIGWNCTTVKTIPKGDADGKQTTHSKTTDSSQATQPTGATQENNQREQQRAPRPGPPKGGGVAA